MNIPLPTQSIDGQRTPARDAEFAAYRNSGHANATTYESWVRSGFHVRHNVGANYRTGRFCRKEGRVIYDGE